MAGQSLSSEEDFSDALESQADDAPVEAEVAGVLAAAAALPKEDLWQDALQGPH